MANNNYNYGYNPYYFDLSQPFFYQETPQYPPQHLPQHSPSQTNQQAAKQPQQQAAQAAQADPEEIPRGAKKQQRERWNPEDERVLVQLWAEHNERLESKESRKVWDEIAKTLNETRKIKKTVDQCQRKIKHLKTLYKERKDWNRRQTGGHIRKSPHYDEFDKVLGCKDIITCKNVEQMGTSTATSSTDSTTCEDKDSDKETSSVESTPSPKSAAGSAVKKTLTKRQERKRKGRNREDSEPDDDDLKKAVKKMAQEDDQMARLVDTMQQSQNQQMQLMNQLLTSFNRYMDKKFE